MCYIHRTTNKSTVLHAYNETTAYTLHSGEYDGNIEMNRRVRYTRYFWKRWVLMPDFKYSQFKEQGAENLLLFGAEREGNKSLECTCMGKSMAC